jgi:hypothetical protein
MKRSCRMRSSELGSTDACTIAATCVLIADIAMSSRNALNLSGVFARVEAILTVAL